MDIISSFFQSILHIDQYLVAFVAEYGTWSYVVLGLIIFCETGLVVTPFLPGDSLLFAAGSLTAQQGSNLSLTTLLLLLILASILGNQINYMIGRFIGPRIFSAKKSRLFNPAHLKTAHDFYEKHGGKTIIFARFLPILRTFVPFIAGIGAMDSRKFTLYNIVSGFIWISSLLGAGYFLGTIPFIQRHFSLVIYLIIAISLLPPLLTILAPKKR